MYLDLLGSAGKSKKQIKAEEEQAAREVKAAEERAKKERAAARAQRDREREIQKEAQLQAAKAAKQALAFDTEGELDGKMKAYLQWFIQAAKDAKRAEAAAQARTTTSSNKIERPKTSPARSAAALAKEKDESEEPSEAALPLYSISAEIYREAVDAAAAEALTLASVRSSGIESIGPLGRGAGG